ncbi:MAG: exodeoxyribonuclease III [Myxococcota bacterium]
MKLATWNVNSIRARIDRLRPWLDAERPDVVCLQETKARDDVFPIDQLRASGYRAAILGQRTYNGVAVLAREELGEPRDVGFGFRDAGDDTQARFLDVRVGDLRVLCAYVPNGRAVGTEHFAFKLDWLDRVRRYLGEHCDPGEPLALCGDLNVAPEAIDVHDPAAWEGQVLFHPDERAALRRLLDWGLVDVVRASNPEPGLYSWWDYRMLAFPKNRGLRIDHVFCTHPLAERVSKARIDREMRKVKDGKPPSDHAPVIVTID